VESGAAKGGGGCWKVKGGGGEKWWWLFSVLIWMRGLGLLLGFWGVWSHVEEKLGKRWA